MGWRYMLGFAPTLRSLQSQILCRLYKSPSKETINWAVQDQPSVWLSDGGWGGGESGHLRNSSLEEKNGWTTSMRRGMLKKRQGYARTGWCFRRHFKKACRLWERQKKLKGSVIASIMSHVNTPNDQVAGQLVSVCIFSAFSSFFFFSLFLFVLTCFSFLFFLLFFSFFFFSAVCSLHSFSCVHACDCVCVCVCVCVHACDCVCVCVHACDCVCACIWLCVHACDCVCDYVYDYMIVCAGCLEYSGRHCSDQSERGHQAGPTVLDWPQPHHHWSVLTLLLDLLCLPDSLKKKIMLTTQPHKHGSFF